MFIPEIHASLGSFLAVGLDEMDGIRLMNRVEMKYLFSVRKLPYLLDNLSGIYKVLEIDMIRVFPYHTTYLDTSGFLFYHQQLTGKLARHKVRYRRYESTGVTFLEVKKRTNKNRTIKWRIENNLNSNFPDENAASFIQEYIPYDSPDLRPVLINGFTRITLAGIELKERITIDYDLTFSSPDGIKAELPFLAIAELKREGFSGQSPFSKIIKQNGIRSTGFSKYSIGNSLLRDMPRKNLLKPKLLLINKIENEYNESYRT
ncbi:MAG: polyphosphate polymerase domain-containing protein [Bacteroidota bacterium]